MAGILAVFLVVFLAARGAADRPLTKAEQERARQDRPWVLGRVAELQAQLHRAWDGALAGASDISDSLDALDPTRPGRGPRERGKARSRVRGFAGVYENPVIFTGDLESRPREWPLLHKSLERGYRADISPANPLLVLTPVLESPHVEGLASKFGREGPKLTHVIGQRALHAVRLIRLARDFVHRRLNLSRDSEPLVQRQSGAEEAQGARQKEDTRVALVMVLVPLELEEVLCQVLEDEFKEWPTKALCRNYGYPTKSSDGSSARGGSGPQRGRVQEFTLECSYAMWGSSANASLDGSILSASYCPDSVGVAVNLDKGDRAIPKALYTPSWIEGSFPGEEELRVKDGGVTIVTGTSDNHAQRTLQLINSVLIYAPSSSVPVSLVVYTMADISEETREKMRCIRRQLEEAGVPTALREFDFGKHPAWMHIKSYRSGWFGWKAVMVWENMVLSKGPVLWLDGADRVYSDSALPNTLEALKKQSFVGITKPGWGSNYRWTHTNTALFLGSSPPPHLNQCCGCLFGVTPDIYARVVRPFYECSKTLQCISPNGANMFNHRQDQSVLNTLALSLGFTCSGVDPMLKVKCDHYWWECRFYRGNPEGAAKSCGFHM